jgi:NAD(P)-dependent dehydrogenase (short-subunit alcohol dehydrogenase family)
VRSVILTGVSRGLGAAFFDEFHAAGDRILALGRRFTAAQHNAERSAPQAVRLRTVDLAYGASLPTAGELSSFTLDAAHIVLVLNAGVVDPVGAVGSLTPAEVQNAVAVNLTAPMLLTNAVLAGVRHQYVTILFITSGAAKHVVGGWSVYGATKRGGEAFVEALTAQYADHPSIHVASVDPGVLDTDMQARLREIGKTDVYFPDRDRFMLLHERGQLADPRTVARSILAQHVRP